MLTRLGQTLVHQSIDSAHVRWAMGVNLLLLTVFASLAVTCHGTLRDVLLGLGLYTLGEYGIHRWVVHGLWGRIGAGHHDHPGADYAVPWTAIFFGGLALLCLCALVVGWGTAASLLLGAIVMHSYADALHEWIHQGTAPTALRTHHLQHHAAAQHNFGLTTTLWDRLGGTRGPPGPP